MIEDQLYRETLLDLYRNPKNKGELPNYDIEVYDLNPLCGDEIKIQLKFKSKQGLRSNELQKATRPSDGQEGKIIEKAVFSGNGCAISQASAEILTGYIKGKNLEELKNLQTTDLLRMVGINPPPARLNCALLSLIVLKKALVRN